MQYIIDSLLVLTISLLVNSGEIYVAFFNLNSRKTLISARISDVVKAFPSKKLKVDASCSGQEVWSGRDFGVIKDTLSTMVEMHGCALFVLNCS